MSHLLIVPVLLPLLTGILLILLTGRPLQWLRLISLLSSIALICVCVQLVQVAVTDQIAVYALGNWAPPFGIVLVLDRMSALMLLATSVLAFCSLLYTLPAANKDIGHLHALLHFLLLGVNGAFLTGDIFNLFVFFEILLLASYALLLHGGGRRIKAGLHYVILNLAGSALFLIAVAALYGLTGTLNMADMAVRVSTLDADSVPLAASAGLLLFLVFGLKAAIVPLYFWLPQAYASASAPVAAMFAIMTKIGVYAIIRVYTLMFGDTAGPLAHFIQPWLWPLALITLLLGFIGVLAARTLALQVAYLVIVSVGTLLAGVSINTEAALSATFYYLLHSTWICGALFLLSDLIRLQRGGSADNIIVGPALPQAALLGGLFFVAAISAIGMPPLSGFIGKVLLLRSLTSGWDALWLWLVVLSSSLAVLTALSRSGSTFFWRTEKQIVEAPRADKWSLAATIGLISTSILLTIGGKHAMVYTDALARQVLTPEHYISAVQAHEPASGGQP